MKRGGEMRLLDRLFGRYKMRFFPMGTSNGFTPIGSLREDELIGSIADVIARNVGKLQPKVVGKDAKGMVLKNDYLAKLLTLRPCPEMSTYDFLYRMASDLVYTSNAFAIIFYSEDFLRITAIQPITVRSFEMVEDSSGKLFFRFVWEYDSKEYTVPYEMVVHLKAHYNKKRFTGTPPDNDLDDALKLMDTANEGIRSAVRNGNGLKGYLQYKNFIDEDEMKKKVQDFQKAYMNAENEGGLAGLDGSMEYKEFAQRSANIPTTQMQFLRENIYRYYGINEKILSSSQTAEEWNAFYESVIEPIAIQLSLEFTYKIFSERERSFGNKIVFSADRLQYADWNTRKDLAGQMFDRGIITINEYREIMYMPPIEDGDIRQISLNYVKINDQSVYQVGKGGETDGQSQTNVGGEEPDADQR